GTSLVFKLQSAVATSHTSEIRALRRPVESTLRSAITVQNAPGDVSTPGNSVVHDRCGAVFFFSA
ncbi:hypothetical protein, partial [Streptomyces sp. NPDC050564]|uniref:hypothetical protein n=1 Tax=Streptomyces sp. NPDC050564 TaxID=3365631 RepID=UPI0037959448